MIYSKSHSVLVLETSLKAETPRGYAEGLHSSFLFSVAFLDSFLY